MRSDQTLRYEREETVLRLIKCPVDKYGQYLKLALSFHALEAMYTHVTQTLAQLVAFKFHNLHIQY